MAKSGRKKGLIKTPISLDILAWGDLLFGVALVGIAIYIAFDFVHGLARPLEYSQWYQLFAPFYVLSSAVALVTGVFLMATPYRLSHALGLKQLYRQIKSLMFLNGGLLLVCLLQIHVAYAPIALIAIMCLSGINSLCLQWAKQAQ